jgi:hypothetical protein
VARGDDLVVEGRVELAPPHDERLGGKRGERQTTPIREPVEVGERDDEGLLEESERGDLG